MKRTFLVVTMIMMSMVAGIGLDYSIMRIKGSRVDAQSGGTFSSAIFIVTPNTGTTFDTAALPVGAFTQEGTFVGLQGGTGKFYRDGVKFPSGAVKANDSYVSRDFNGAIYATGIINPPILDGVHFDQLTAVVGGVGTFRGANGQMILKLNSDGTFKACFEPTHLLLPNGREIFIN